MLSLDEKLNLTRRLLERLYANDKLEYGPIDAKDNDGYVSVETSADTLVSLFDAGITVEELDNIILPILRDDEGLLWGWYMGTPRDADSKFGFDLNVEVMEIEIEPSGEDRQLIQLQETNPSKPLKASEVSFNHNSGAIVVRGEEVLIPGRIKQIICETLFGEEFGKKFRTDMLEEAIDRSADTFKQSDRRIYDGVLAINKIMKNHFGIERFIDYAEERYWIRKEVFK